MSVRKRESDATVLRQNLAQCTLAARRWTPKPTGVDPPQPSPPPPSFPPANADALAVLQARLKADRDAQIEAARQLAEQAKAARTEAKAAREAEKTAAAQLSAATKEARERARQEKQAEADRKRLEKEALKEARESAAAQAAAEKAAARQDREAEKRLKNLAAQEAKEAREAERVAKEARRLEEQRERELRDAMRKQQQEAVAAAKAEETARKALKRKAETEAKEAAAAAKRARIQQEECDEAMRQIHLLRDEMETVGERAEELLAKLMNLNCGASTVELVWIRRLVDEAVAAQRRLMVLIEANKIDWEVSRHNEMMELEDGEESDEEEDGEEGEGEEDEGGVKVGRFGNLEVVADEDEDEEGGADAFDQDEYKHAMAALRQGRMALGDLKGMDLDAQVRN